MTFHHPVSRRLFLKSSGLLLGAAAVPLCWPGYSGRRE
jgi:hypothetical protein